MIIAPAGTASPTFPAEHAVRGLHAITLSERQLDPSATMLTDLLGMSLAGEEGDRSRFGMAGGGSGALVDVYAGVKDRGFAGRRHRPPRRVPGAGPGDHDGLAAGADRPWGVGDPDPGPAVLQVHLLPRAGWRAVRDRHRRAGLRRGRAVAGARTAPEAAARGWSPTASRSPPPCRRCELDVDVP